MRQCGVNRDVDRMEKSIKSINNKIDSLEVPSKEEIRKETYNYFQNGATSMEATRLNRDTKHSRICSILCT